jgi:AraC family transcriptional regulator
MSLMQAQKQRDLKYQASTLLNSSRDLGWSTMFAELRSHGPYEQPGTAGPHLEIALAVRGSDEGLVATKFAGTLRRVRPTTGTIWLRPAEAAADECRMAPSAWEAIHLYMSSVVFARLTDDYDLPAGPDVPSAMLVVCRTNSSTRSACQCCRR